MTVHSGLHHLDADQHARHRPSKFSSSQDCAFANVAFYIDSFANKMERLQGLLLTSDSGENSPHSFIQPLCVGKSEAWAPPQGKTDNFRKSKDIAPTFSRASVFSQLGYSCGEHAPLKWSEM